MPKTITVEDNTYELIVLLQHRFHCKTIKAAVQTISEIADNTPSHADNDQTNHAASSPRHPRRR